MAMMEDRAVLIDTNVLLSATAHPMRTFLLFIAAAIFEIGGCFAFWAWLRQGRAPALGALGLVSLTLFALCLSGVDSVFAGRAFAAYGGIYIAASLLWLRLIEGGRPDVWDLLGGALCVLGSLIIVFGRR